MSSYLQSTIDHGVCASLDIHRLLFLQLNGMFGIKSEEVNQLRSGIDLRLDHRLTLEYKDKYCILHNKMTMFRFILSESN